MPEAASRSLIGRQVGGYKVVALLGAGGMGEVYRARDVRLGRDVALKVLQEDRAGNPAQQARFLREAQAASALNHPNILAVFDVGVEDGVAFIVSELIDGTSLRAIVERAPLPMTELLSLAAQIADGLTAAHEADIVHRDLKPENVMITRDGRAKILDFGLAKSSAPKAPSDRSVPQVTQTEAGLIQGTVPYMSPEQARGASADFRADQFALGLVMYEMATGTQAFRRETPVQTLSAILTDEAPSIVALNPRAPAPLRWLIERCLAKDPRQRYAATQDLAQDLRTLRERLAEATTGAPALDTSPSPVPRLVITITITAVTAILASGLLLSAALQMPGLDASTQRLTPIATNGGYQGMPAWSPVDGALAYIGEVDGVLQVFTRSLSSNVSTQVTHGPIDCRDPFWSADGRSIYYISAMGTGEGLRMIGAAGGMPATVRQNVSSAAISPNGETLAMFREERARPGMSYQTLWIASPPDAEPVRYEKPPFDERRFGNVALHFSPDGSKLGIWMRETREAADITAGRRYVGTFWIVPWPTGDPRQVDALSSLPPSWPAFSWFPDNRHLVIAAPQPDTLGTRLWWMDTSSNAAERLTLSSLNENYPAVSRDGGTIAYAVENEEYDLMEVPLNGSGMRSLLGTTRSEIDPTWSATSAQYAYVTDRMGPQQIWRRSLDNPTGTPSFDVPVVTAQDFPNSSTYLFSAPVFSPNGQQLAYERHSSASNQIWLSPAAGGRPQPLTATSWFQTSPSWSPDGDMIAFTTFLQGKWELAKVQVGSNNVGTIASDITPFAHPQWSPNGRWIACDTTQPKGLSLVSPEGGPLHHLSDAAWLVYGWSSDSTKLYGLRRGEDGRRLVLASLDVASGVERILNADLGPVPLTTLPIRGFARMSDKSFAISIARVKSTVWLLEGFKRPLGRFERLLPEWLRPGR